MEHRVAHRKLQRTTAHRLAMLKNMVTSLLEHERITTTIPKAKEARRMAEKIITLGKRGGLHNVRLAERTVHNRAILAKVFGELKDRYANRPGGYTRLLKIGFRRGDATEMAMLELVDRVEKVKEDAAESEKKAEAATAPKKEAKAKEEAPKKEAAPKGEAKAKQPAAKKKDE
ncbi:MAG: 50S ribosomal protein L17 [Myxococcaceae bacterium]|nr:50S ribosomal protein L17 [Myxococcaceae bacterium]